MPCFLGFHTIHFRNPFEAYWFIRLLPGSNLPKITSAVPLCRPGFELSFKTSRISNKEPIMDILKYEMILTFQPIRLIQGKYDPCYQLHYKDGDTFSGITIRGFFYHMKSVCHLKWQNFSHLQMAKIFAISKWEVLLFFQFG